MSRIDFDSIADGHQVVVVVYGLRDDDAGADDIVWRHAAADAGAWRHAAADAGGWYHAAADAGAWRHDSSQMTLLQPAMLSRIQTHPNTVWRGKSNVATVRTHRDTQVYIYVYI